MAENSQTKKNTNNTTQIAVFIAVAAILLIFIAALYTQAPAQEVSLPAQQAQEQVELPQQATGSEKPAANYIYPASNHFGVVNARQDFDGVNTAGITWNRAYPGPFNWEKVGYNKYDWSAADAYVKETQEHSLGILATVWPYNSLDQKNCYSAEVEIEYGDLAKDLAGRRRKPCDSEAYSTFLNAMVSRYDADGKDDMPGLKYGIKYWEIASEPEVQQSSAGRIFFQGEGKDYAELLKTSYSAIKSADPNAKVLAGAVSKEGIGSTFWFDVFYNAKDSFDIANYHCSDCDDAARIQEFKNFLSQNRVDKPIWLTGFSVIGTNDKEQSLFLFKAYLTAFGKGVDNVFYERWAEPAGGKMALANIIQLPNERKPAFYTLKALIKKLNNFSSAKEVADQHFEFAVGERTLHAFLKTVDLPASLQGDVIKMDYNGTVRKDKMFNVASSDIPIVIETA